MGEHLFTLGIGTRFFDMPPKTQATYKRVDKLDLKLKLLCIKEHNQECEEPKLVWLSGLSTGL